MNPEVMACLGESLPSASPQSGVLKGQHAHVLLTLEMLLAVLWLIHADCH